MSAVAEPRTVASVDVIARHLVEFGLATAEQITAVQFGLSRQQRNDPMDLLRRLAHAGRVTSFQARMLLKDRARDLTRGPYLLIDLIGSGGMADVYRARHRRTGEIVAIKCLPQKTATNDQAVARFQQEVAAIRNLRHENIVRMIEADRHESGLYLVMELIDGQDLDHLVRQHGPLPVERTLALMLQLARGLEFAHANGVVHRDIKPKNLMLERGGGLKILDFGLARVSEVVELSDAELAARITRPGQVLGTLTYMPPEQSVGTIHADERSDIYSLGCTLFWLLTGRPPFTGRTEIAIMNAHRESAIPYLRESRPEVSERLDQMFHKLVAKNPKFRFASMSEVAAEFESILQEYEASRELSDTSRRPAQDHTDDEPLRLAPKNAEPTRDLTPQPASAAVTTDELTRDERLAIARASQINDRGSFLRLVISGAVFGLLCLLVRGGLTWELWGLNLFDIGLRLTVASIGSGLTWQFLGRRKP